MLALAQVPPMPPDRARQCIQRELGIDDLGEVFEWIELDEPLGSASISQVGYGLAAGRVQGVGVLQGTGVPWGTASILHVGYGVPAGRGCLHALAGSASIS